VLPELSYWDNVHSIWILEEYGRECNDSDY
jgi:hypothetical protein